MADLISPALLAEFLTSKEGSDQTVQMQRFGYTLPQGLQKTKKIIYAVLISFTSRMLQGVRQADPSPPLLRTSSVCYCYAHDQLLSLIRRKELVKVKTTTTTTTHKQTKINKLKHIACLPYSDVFDNTFQFCPKYMTGTPSIAMSTRNNFSFTKWVRARNLQTPHKDIFDPRCLIRAFSERTKHKCAHNI